MILYRTQPRFGTVLDYVSVHVPKCGWVPYKNVVRYMYRNVVGYRTEMWFGTCTETWLSTVPKYGSVRPCFLHLCLHQSTCTEPRLGTVLNHVLVHLPNHVSVRYPTTFQYMYRNVVEYGTKTCKSEGEQSTDSWAAAEQLTNSWSASEQSTFDFMAISFSMIIFSEIL